MPLLRRGPKQPAQILVRNEESTRPGKDPQRVRSETVVETSKSLLSVRPTDGGWDVGVEGWGGVL